MTAAPRASRSSRTSQRDRDREVSRAAARAAKTLVLIPLLARRWHTDGANDGGIDHLDAGGARAGLVQRLQHHIPDPRLRPASALAIEI